MGYLILKGVVPKLVSKSSVDHLVCTTEMTEECSSQSSGLPSDSSNVPPQTNHSLGSVSSARRSYHPRNDTPHRPALHLSTFATACSLWLGGVGRGRIGVQDRGRRQSRWSRREHTGTSIRRLCHRRLAEPRFAWPVAMGHCML